jgi:hypothetical protein
MQRTLLIGADETGKSRAAKLLIRSQRVWHINFRSLNKLSKEQMIRQVLWGLGQFKNGDVLLFDEVQPEALRYLMEYLLQDEIVIEAQMKAPFSVFPAAAYIIGWGVSIDDVPKDLSYLSLYNIITCRENRDHSIEMSLHHMPEIDLKYSPSTSSSNPA